MQPIQFNFDVTNIDPFVAGSAPVPTGAYAAAIRNMQVKANGNAATGHNLALEFVITEGEFKGRKVYENLNLWHTGSTQAAEIAMKQLSSIGHAVGVLQGGDLTLLANKVMMIEVDYQDETPASVNPNTGAEIKARPARNNILRHDPYDAGAAAATQPHVPAAQPVSQPNAAAAAQAPAMQAAAQAAPAAAAAPAPAAQAAPAFNPATAAAPATQAAAPAGNGAVPPWQQK
jgi:hypothetical protein